MSELVPNIFDERTMRECSFIKNIEVLVTYFLLHIEGGVLLIIHLFLFYLLNHHDKYIIMLMF